MDHFCFSFSCLILAEVKLWANYVCSVCVCGGGGVICVCVGGMRLLFLCKYACLFLSDRCGQSHCKRSDPHNLHVSCAVP